MTSSAEPGAGARVSTLELFFDLVFVFTVTQVAFIVEHHLSWPSTAQAVLELLVVYWMYGGYAWLGNAIGAGSMRSRMFLLLGMAAFFVVSLTLPRAFGADAATFAVAYLVLTVVHLAGFLLSGRAGHIHAMTRIGSVNLIACGLLLLAAALPGWPRWLLWIAAAALQWIFVGVVMHWAGGIEVDHFAERHGLMIIIVLGESLVSVAIVVQSLPVTASLVAGALSGLAASAAMWWLYFAGEDEAAAEALRRVPYADRGRSGLLGYDLPHVTMMAGIVSVAAGTRLSLPDLTAPTSVGAATLVGAGAGVYLLGLSGFRLVLRVGPAAPRAAVAAVTVATIPIGRSAGVAAQLLAVAAVLAALAVAERRSAALAVSGRMSP